MLNTQVTHIPLLGIESTGDYITKYLITQGYIQSCAALITLCLVPVSNYAAL